MGHIIYGSGGRYEFEDRQLAHLQVAIQHKLRRHQSFLMSWTSEAEGRMSIWISPDIPLAFYFTGSRLPKLNDQWVQLMEEMANTPRGLVVISEEKAKHLAHG